MHFLIQYVLLVFGLAAGLMLFVTLKWEMYAQNQKNRKRLDEVLDRLHRAEAPAPDPEPELVRTAAPVRSGMNLNRRVQAVRLLRRGEDVGHVAAALGVPRA